MPNPTLPMQDETPSQDTETQQTGPRQPDVRALIESVNIADELDEEELNKIGYECSEGFEFDLRSRERWERELDEWTKLAMQTREAKSWPWPHASNIKYPLLSTAAMQFAARAYPSLVPSNGQIVKATVNGKDPKGQKLERADRVSTFMSYQIMEEMEGWEEDMDKLLIMVPIVGTVFKKTYWDSVKKQNCSRLVLPKNFVVNYWAESLECAERMSEIIPMSQRKLKERQMAGLYCDCDLGEPSTAGMLDQNNRELPPTDDTTPYTIIEQHTFYDLDKDGYPEPYIVTFERTSRKVLRIAARFDQQSIFVGADGKLQKIEPIMYYTKFGFVPNPDGSFYDIGFGVLLGPINEAVNTLINQLTDAGTLNNLQSGFIGKGLRLRMGEQRFLPGEWKAVNATGDDLKKQIVPLPSKEPSNVLFQLMGSLITSGKELASVAEIFVGKMPGQNTPATTTMASIEQGMKVFTAVYKRLFRSLKEEFKKLYRLNEIYLDPNTEVKVLDVPIGPADFSTKDCDIEPGADPTAVSQTEKLLKAQGLMELMAGAPGILDPIKILSRVLEAQEQPNWQELFTQQIQQTGQVPPPPPDPKMLELQMKSQAMQQDFALKSQEQQANLEFQARDKQQQMAMAAQKHAQDMQMKQDQAQLDATVALHKEGVRQVEAQQQMRRQQDMHQQALVHNDQKAQQQREIAKEQAKSAQQSKTSSTGKGTPSRKQ